MRIAQKAGFICSDCSNVDLGECTLDKAIEEYREAPWEEEIKKFEELDGKQPIPCWPDLTFRIENFHISFMRSSTGPTFTVEVFIPRPKKIFGLFNMSKCFDFKNVEFSRGEEYLKAFYKKEPLEQYAYYSEQHRVYS